MVNGLVVLLQGGASLCSAAALWLRSNGYAVCDTANIDGLLAQVTAVRPDLSILDVSATAEAVDALCRRVKSNPELEPLPVLALTSPAECIEPGCRDVAQEDLDRVACCNRILVRRLESLVGALAGADPGRQALSAVDAPSGRWRQVVAHLPNCSLAVFNRDLRLVFGTGDWDATVGTGLDDWLVQLPDALAPTRGTLATLVRRTFEKPQASPIDRVEQSGPHTFRAVGLVDDTRQIGEVLLLQQDARVVPASPAPSGGALRYAALADASPDPMALIGPELDVLYLNAAARNLLGIHGQNVSITAICPQPYLDTYRPFIDAVFRDGAWRRLVLPLASTRNVSWQDVTLSPVRDDGGCIGAVLAVARDTTAQELVRIRLERHSRRLQVLNELGQALVATHDPAVVAETLLNLATPTIGAEASVFLLRSDNLYRVVDIWGAFTEQQRERLKAWHVPSLNIPEPGIWAADQLPAWAARARDLTGFEIGSLMIMPIQHGAETIGLVGAGHRRRDAFHDEDWQFFQSAVQWASIAVRNAQLYSDVTAALEERRRAEGHLVQAEKVAAIGRLAASLTHEVNNPLQAVRGCLELAAEELAQPQRPEQLPRYLAVALEELARVATLVGGMRELYRPAEPEVRDSGVREIVSGVLDLLSRQLRDQRIEVECELEPGLPQLRVNPDQIHQVLLNIILNAIDAMPQGGALLIRAQLARRSVAGQESTLGVEVLVYDDGVGISEQAGARLFEPFFTTKPRGSGLGLYTSYGLIQAHRGAMSVCRRASGGTRVGFWLPLDGSHDYGGDQYVGEDSDR